MNISLRGAILCCIAAFLLVAAGCGPANAPVAPTPPPLAKELVLYSWADYLPQPILDAFYKETGVSIRVEVYDDQDIAVESILAGKEYDLAIIGNELIPGLVSQNALAEINYANVPNFKHVSASFRNLVYDPNNRHTIPYNWGTTGLLVRTDVVKQPVKRWADLWNPELDGKIAIWDMYRTTISIALKSLGYDANSEDPEQLEAALQRLNELKPRTILWSGAEPDITPPLMDGEAIIAYGWAYDAMVAREQDANITYVLPEEGTLLWGENLAILANSKNQYTAEVFLNFLLRPEMSAIITNDLYYANANQSSRILVDVALRDDPLIFPPAESLSQAEIVMPLSPEGEKLYAKIWQQFTGQ